METNRALKAPFPYFRFGGKSRIAGDVWSRFGNPPNYVEPFAGSLAMLLARPHEPGIETVNDLDGYVSNFWRAVQAAPDEVAAWADWPVNENDLHARHAWLLRRRDGLQTALEGDPDYYDSKVAGWWVWGICAWIGSGWCAGNGPWQVVDGQLVNVRESSGGTWCQLPHLGGGQGINRRLPHLGGGQGINRRLPHLGNAGQGINRRRPNLGDAGQGQGACAEWRAHLETTMRDLADRLRRVRVCCGDWPRICGPSPTIKHGLTAVFLDPPYSHSERDPDVYRVDQDVAAQVRDWALAQGDSPLMRIALCGYESEHDMPPSWERVAWKAKGGYGSQGNGRGRENAAREVVWFSPHCLRPDRPIQIGLFDTAT